MTEEKKKPRRRRFELDTVADVKRCMAQAIRQLRRVKCEDPIADPIKINKAKAMFAGLSRLGELMKAEELEARLTVLERRRTEAHESLDAVQ